MPNELSEWVKATALAVAFLVLLGIVGRMELDALCADGSCEVAE